MRDGTLIAMVFIVMIPLSVCLSLTAVSDLVHALERKIEYLRRENEALKARIAQLEKQLKALNSTTIRLENQLNATTTRLDTFITEYESFRRNISLAFFVVLLSFIAENYNITMGVQSLEARG